MKDNGKGFQRTPLFERSAIGDLGTAESKDGFGLFNIQERVSDLGGRVWLALRAAEGDRGEDSPAARSGYAKEVEVEHEHQNSIGR